MRTYSAALFAALLFSPPVLAQRLPNGITLQLQLAQKQATHDPLGIWSDSDLEPLGGKLSSLYVATAETKVGTFFLSQIDSQCSMQNNCQAILVLKHPDGSSSVVANPSLVEGGKAVLSPDLKTIFTEEVGDAGKPFTGHYAIGQ